MTEARVIKACFWNWRTVPTRKVLQLVFEVPLDQQTEVLMRLGAPMPDTERWCAIALLDQLVASETEHHAQERRANLSVVGKQRYAEENEMERARTRSALLAKDPEFIVWASQNRGGFNVRDESSAAEYIRKWCAVDSRSAIATDQGAYAAYVRLERDFETAVGRATEMRA